MLTRALNARVHEVLEAPTALDPARRLSERLGAPVLLKREDTTPVFSFKLRGAYNRVAQLSAEEAARGVIAASAGNHAQGVAYAARKLGLRCRIVMPVTTPSIKTEAVRRLGGEVDLFGDSFSDAALRLVELARETAMTVVPPYDDLDVIAGQATIGLELLSQAPRDLAAVFVPIGGGGLAAGVAAVFKAARPSVRIIGVEPDDSAAMTESLAAGRRVALARVGLFADGVAVRQVGELTFELCRRFLDDCITVTSDEMCAAIEDGFEDTRGILEPAGALGIAGAKRALETGLLGRDAGSFVAIASGANMNFNRLRYVAERAEVGQHREAILAVTIPERPGSFLRFCEVMGRRPITEFNYRLASREAAHVFVGLQVGGRDGASDLAGALSAAGYPVVDLSQDDVAKTHVRHMVGGRASSARDEVLYRFEFPERPGALLEFLSTLGGRWNISLFHYRNHGAAFGRVLCGFEVAPLERPALATALDACGFEHHEESENPAVGLFLR